MDIIEIPFVEKVGITKSGDGKLELPFNKSIQNHLQTIHASAQFSLAETSTGELLQTLFPELVEKVIPVLRDSQIKFKKPATKDILAYPAVADEEILKFNEQFAKKGRSSILVNVEIKDSDDVITCSGVFNWFIQRI